MTTPNILQCSFCPNRIEEANAFIEYTVWVSGPKKDGATERKPTGRCACPDCMSAMRAGQPPGQHTLFDN